MPTTGNDTLIGTPGNDTIDALAGNDVVAGMEGNDSLDGNTGNDWITGNFGDDTLIGGDGADSLLGSSDNDVLRGGFGNDWLDGGSGANDLAWYRIADYGGQTMSVTASLAGGWVTTSLGDLDGLVGIERLWTGQGNDILIGDANNNEFDADNGNDFIDAGAGFDVILGGNGDDTLLGGDNGDTIVPGSGRDYVDGGAGSAFSFGNELRLMNETAGVSLFTALGGYQSSAGWEGYIRFDVITTTSFNDLIVLGVVPSGDTKPTINASGGADWVNIAAAVSYEVDGSTGNDTLLGNTMSDTLRGGADDDYIEGGDGLDQLYGDFGFDILRGGNGNDFLSGGDGDDVIDGGAGRDVLIFDSLKGPVTVRLDTGYAFGALIGLDVISNIENVRGTDSGDVIYGRDLASDGEWLQGLVGNDFIVGLGGNDTLWGGDGADTLLGGDGADQIEPGDGAGFVDGGAGVDILMYLNEFSGVSITMAEPGSIVAGSAVVRFQNVEWLFGTDGNDVLMAGDGAYIIDGRDGDDVLTVANYQIGLQPRLDGGDGNDSLFGGGGIDTILGGRGNDFIESYDGADSLLGGDGNDSIFGGNGNDVINGGIGSNILDGGLGRDSITSLSSTDTITGGGGIDTISVLATRGNNTDYYTYVYTSASDAPWGGSFGASERIVNFAGNDKFDLTALAGGPGGAWNFIGNNAFFGNPLEVRIFYDAPGNFTAMEIDLDGNLGADIVVVLEGYGAGVGVGNFIV